jgi:hypothetical protein
MADAAAPIRQTNSHGCIPYRRCKCPTVYHRCSLWTDYPEYDEDPEPNLRSRRGTANRTAKPPNN